MAHDIAVLRTTPDKKHLFVSDNGGNLKQICLLIQRVTHDYGEISDYEICSMATTSDNKYVFVGCGKRLKQYRVDSHKLVKAYRFNASVNSVITTFDSKFAFARLFNGSLHQLCIRDKTVSKHYGEIAEYFIPSMVVTRDNNFLIAGYLGEGVRKIMISNKKVVKDLYPIIPGEIATMQLTQGDESLFVYDFQGNLKLVDLADGTTIHDFTRGHPEANDRFQEILVTRDGEYLLTTSDERGFKQFSVRGRALVRDFGRLAGLIMSICD